MGSEGSNEWERRYQASLEAQHDEYDSVPSTGLLGLTDLHMVSSAVGLVISLAVLAGAAFVNASTGVQVTLAVVGGCLAVGACVMLWMHAREQRRAEREEFERRPRLRRRAPTAEPQD